ncbi:predicted protein [Uncinocarpus reesii 1704]|uniref:Uncharacterized protein n=1 Tax=Uncinocarpus reesii (strain UAMH 1704) TaxID=336963 RepID=C4JVT8_UNCRE|nr:uncharacterized protein UREG_06680 [Uncinocarpus reesii 1704]EEP81815.1 predicted protein [Uncinocarpus reesii 1704]
MASPDQMVAQKDHRAQEQATAAPLAPSAAVQVAVPRVTIKYCTQCRWMLRAAYFAQELLSTFSTTLGEVSLVPSTGGIFTVTILHASNTDSSPQETVLWDRKVQGGFPGKLQSKNARYFTKKESKKKSNKSFHPPLFTDLHMKPPRQGNMTRLRSWKRVRIVGDIPFVSR